MRLFAVLFAFLVGANTRTIELSPSSAGGIKSALRGVNPGDVVRLSDGTYSGPDNCDLTVSTDQVTIRSTSGDPAAAVIRCIQSRCLRVEAQEFALESVTLEGPGSFATLARNKESEVLQSRSDPDEFNLLPQLSNNHGWDPLKRKPVGQIRLRFGERSSFRPQTEAHVSVHSQAACTAIAPQVLPASSGSLGTSSTESMDCTWTIDAPPAGQQTWFIVESIATPQMDPLCQLDFLNISSGDTWRAVCGSMTAGLACVASGDTPCVSKRLYWLMDASIVVSFRSQAKTHDFRVSWGPWVSLVQVPIGGCLLANGASFSLISVRMTACRAEQGGAMALLTSTATLTGCLFNFNLGTRGGAVYASNSQLNALQVEFTSNVASVEIPNRFNVDSALDDDVVGGALSVVQTQLGLDRCSMTDNRMVPIFPVHWVQPSFFLQTSVKGGVLYAFDSQVTISDSTFLLNDVSATSQTGWWRSMGSVIAAEHGSLSILSSTIQNSTARTYVTSGVVAVDLAQFTFSASSISNTLFSAVSSQGVGMYANSSKTHIVDSLISGTTIVQGTTCFGAGLFMNGGQTLIVSSRVSDISADSKLTRGVGLHCASGELVMRDCTVSQCSTVVWHGSTDSSGGGISTLNARVELYRVAVVDNFLWGLYAEGGGLYLESSSVSTEQMSAVGNEIDGTNAVGGGLTLRRCSFFASNTTISNNTVRIAHKSFGAGGGVAMVRSHTQFTGCTISDNLLTDPGRDVQEQNFVNLTTGCLSENEQLIAPSGELHVTEYQDLDSCAWTIFPGDFTQMIVEVLWVGIEDHKSCGYDALVIKDGDTVAGIYCGTGGVIRCVGDCLQPMLIRTGTIRVSFSADDQFNPGASGGFGLRWHSTGKSSNLKPLLMTSAASFGILEAPAYGGGLYSQESQALIMRDSTVSRNVVSQAVSVLGGGLCLNDHLGQRTQLPVILFEDVRVRNNTSTGGWLSAGGGMHFGGGIQLVLRRVETAGNVATGNFSCQFLSGTILCGGAFGGGFSLDGLLIVVAEDHKAVANVASCSSTIGCVSAGAGVYAQNSLVKFSNLLLMSNVASCYSVLGVAFGGGIAGMSQSDVQVSGASVLKNSVLSPFGGARGGGGFCDDSQFNVTDAVYTNNSATAGRSAGGAIFFQDGQGSNRNVSFYGNLANLGGAVTVQGRAQFDMMDSMTRENQATVYGGALSISGLAVVRLNSTIFYRDRALLNQEIYVEDSRVTLSMFDCQLDLMTGQAALLVGEHSVFDAVNQWRCASLGTEFVLEHQPSPNAVTVLTCAPCGPGFYSLGVAHSGNLAKCRPCPAGGRCRGGHGRNGTGMLAQQARWGFDTQAPDGSMVIEFRGCPDGYCCPRNHECDWDHCDGNRQGVLCGSCKPGFSNSLGVFLCAPDERCHAVAWLAPLMIAVSFGTTMGILLGVSKKITHLRKEVLLCGQHARDFLLLPSDFDGGEVTILIFFYQIAPLVISRLTQSQLSTFSEFILSVFNIDVFNSGGVFQGFCPYPGFSPISKLAFGFVFPLMLLFWVAVAAIGKMLLKMSQGHLACLAGPISTTFIICSFGFSIILTATFKLVTCVEIRGSLRMFYYGDVECYSTWQQLLLGLVLPLLCAYPLTLAFVVWRYLRAEKMVGAARTSRLRLGLQQVLSFEYREGALMTEAGLMTERLVYSFLATFIVHKLARALVLAIMAVVSLVVGFLVSPWRRKEPNHLNILARAVLVVVATWECGVAVLYTDNGDDDLIDKDTLYSWGNLMSFLTALPLCVVVALYGRYCVIWHRRKKTEGECVVHTGGILGIVAAHDHAHVGPALISAWPDGMGTERKTATAPLPAGNGDATRRPSDPSLHNHEGNGDTTPYEPDGDVVQWAPKSLAEVTREVTPPAPVAAQRERGTGTSRRRRSRAVLPLEERDTAPLQLQVDDVGSKSNESSKLYESEEDTDPSAWAFC